MPSPTYNDLGYYDQFFLRKEQSNMLELTDIFNTNNKSFDQTEINISISQFSTA